MKKIIVAALLTLSIASTVEIDRGTCLNEAMDGHVDASTAGVEEPYTYISYKDIDVAPGEIVYTVTAYPLFAEHTDNYLMIADFVPSTKFFGIR